MLLLDRQSGATSTNASGIQLRLRTDGRVHELLPGKTTIGSSARCNIRIDLPGVQPLHCLVVEGAEGLRIRSWVANTKLNGLRFDESVLSVGDCLSLGAVELDIIDPLAARSQPAVVEAPAQQSSDTELIRA